VGTELRLIDYDGMYVPPMQTGCGEEVGHKHWQHPQRSQRDFGPNMDRFSFIVVDVSLRALIADPALHGRFNEGGETILFKANDYADPSSSEIFRILKAKPELQSAANNLERICGAPISQVPTLEDFLAGNNIPAVIVRAAPAPGRAEGTPKQAAYISAYPVVNAADFSKAVKNVGNRVELVGRITDFKYDIGKRGRGKGKPYVFLNFGPWNSNIVKLTFWSEGLANMTKKPEQSWVGRWVSVTGLIDAPYTSRRYNYTHVGITVTSDGQVQFITEADANYRLGRASGLNQQNNQDVLRNLGAAAQPATPKRVRPLRGVQPTPGSNASQTNRDILNAIRRAPGTPAAGRGYSSPTPSTPPKGNGWGWVGGIIRRALDYLS
jgi:hypothetical protein